MKVLLSSLLILFTVATLDAQTTLTGTTWTGQSGFRESNENCRDIPSPQRYARGNHRHPPAVRIGASADQRHSSCQSFPGSTSSGRAGPGLAAFG